MKTLEKEYFKWLYDLTAGRGKRYKKLCDQLHEKPFRWFVPNDDNRAADGVFLRERFIEEMGLDDSHLEVESLMKRKCTVFEMLVALARRLDDTMYDPDRPDRNNNALSRWFLELLKNLKLDRFYDNLTPDWRFGPMDEAEVDEILEILLERSYDFYGNGSLFPLKGSTPKDLAKVEIWYQMMYYLAENYT